MAETELGGRYRLGAVIGSGGAAEVFRARDRVLDRDVAVKMLRDSVDDADRARFVGEARMLAQLSHVGLVMVLDAGTTEARPYLVMELVEGRTLGAVLRDGPLPPSRAADIGHQVASAVAYAHAQGVVHRDVKPGNVLLGDHGVVKLADFGIARLIGDTVRHTKTGMAMGTPAYLAPEQVTGSPVGPPADVYALGLVLLEAITGERAFPGTPTEAAMARLHRPPAIPAELPAAWRALLTAMTAADPAARPTAEAAAEQLAGLTVVPDQAGATRALPMVVPSVPGAAVDVPTGPISGPISGPVPGPISSAPPAGAASRIGSSRIGAAPTYVKALVLVAVLLVVVVLVAALATGGDADPEEAPAESPETTAPSTPTGSAPTETTPETGGNGTERDDGRRDGGRRDGGSGDRDTSAKGKGKGDDKSGKGNKGDKGGKGKQGGKGNKGNKGGKGKGGKG